MTSRSKSAYLFSAKGAVFIASLGRRPREPYTPKPPALKARFIPFQEEYRELLCRHGIEFDEQYLWD